MTLITLTPSRTVVHIRQENSIRSSSTTSNSLAGGSTTSSSSTNVLTFGDLFPTPTTTDTSIPSRPAVSQNVLMWIFAVIAVSLLSLIVIWRYCCSKIQRKFRGHRSFVGIDSGRSRFGGGGGNGAGLERPQSALLRHHSDLEALPWDNHYHHHHHRGQQHSSRPIILSAPFLHTGLVPLVSQEGVLLDESTRFGGGRHRYTTTRGADIDSGGRRRGNGGADSVLGSYALEELPAYEAGKSPPGYHHVVTTGTGPNSPADTSSPSSLGSSPPPPPPIPYSQRPHTEDNIENGNLNS